MTAAGGSPRDMTARTLARLFGTFHNVTYYAPEMRAFADLGLPEFWRAYMAYRSAPMGAVSASVVQSTFYNFAPAVVEAALPSAWDTTTPAQALTLRDTCIRQALNRALPDADLASVSEIVELALGPIIGCEAGARPLFAAHRELPLPPDPLLSLWHVCTLWREYRGDGHNLALASASIDGIECHVLLAAKGVGTQEVITKIRGWTQIEWQAAHERLASRGLLDQAGEYTPAGRQLRDEIEHHTDRLSARARDRLGTADATRVIELLTRFVDELVAGGAVAGRWPPPQPPG